MGKYWHHRYSAVGMVAVAAVLAGLVWGTFGRSHTKTVVQTKIRTVRVGIPPAPFDGSPQTLANYTRPKTAQQLASCPKGITNSTCYVFQTDKWFLLYAVPR